MEKATLGRRDSKGTVVTRATCVGKETPMRICVFGVVYLAQYAVTLRVKLLDPLLSTIGGSRGS